MEFKFKALELLVLAAVGLHLAVFAAAEPCPKGQVWNTNKNRCALCPPGQVKLPDVPGDESAVCVDARSVCGTAEIGKFGSCDKCLKDQVAVSSRACAPCPAGQQKVPSGVVKSARCEGSCQAKPEVCNGKDDDCDGLIDEGLGSITCGTGACARTVSKCSKGRDQTCTPGAPKTEVCNGIDDDCDGDIDEGNVCGAGACGGEITCGKGACLKSVPTCINGRRQTCKPGPSKPETCNGIDDDCDGNVDDLTIPYIFCEPCNKKVPACTNGRPGSCVGVCSEPCCEECDSKYSSMDDRVACGRSCQLCVFKEECREFATYVAVGAAKRACTDVASSCGLFFAAMGDSLYQTKEQCYFDAYDVCSESGLFFAKGAGANDPSYCRFYSTAGTSIGTLCTTQVFQEHFATRLDELCKQVALNIPVVVKAGN